MNPLTNEELGNVHSNARPPWLTDAEAESLISESTPGLLSNNQKRKLARMRNPKRVGAEWAEQRRKMKRENIDKGNTQAETLGVDESAEWLPSFGGVWQSGPRAASKREFLKEVSKGKRSNASSRVFISDTNEKEASDDVEYVPYVSTRRMKQ